MGSHDSGKSERTSGLGPEDKRRIPPDRRSHDSTRQNKDAIGNREKAGVDSGHVSHASKYGTKLGLRRKR